MVDATDKRIKNQLWVSLGGNQGDVKQVFEEVYQQLNYHLGTIKAKSSLYVTKAWGNEKQPDFLNQVLLMETDKNPFECLDLVLKIEALLGRVRIGEKWGQRIIDIDILFFNQDVIDSKDLKVPHPYIHQRNFILIPLKEINKKFVHPVLKKSIETLNNECKDELDVKLYVEEKI